MYLCEYYIQVFSNIFLKYYYIKGSSHWYKYNTLHPLITSSVCTRYREMLVIEKTTPDKEGSLALGTCTGNERSDQAHISGHRGNCKMFEHNIKDNTVMCIGDGGLGF